MQHTNEGFRDKSDQGSRRNWTQLHDSLSGVSVELRGNMHQDYSVLPVIKFVMASA